MQLVLSLTTFIWHRSILSCLPHQVSLLLFTVLYGRFIELSVLFAHRHCRGAGYSIPTGIYVAVGRILIV